MLQQSVTGAFESEHVRRIQAALINHKELVSPPDATHALTDWRHVTTIIVRTHKSASLSSLMRFRLLKLTYMDLDDKSNHLC